MLGGAPLDSGHFMVSRTVAGCVPVLVWKGMNESDSESARPRKTLLMVSFEQFGYHPDSYEYCRYLADRYRITYLCPDQGLPRKELDGVEVLVVEARARPRPTATATVAPSRPVTQQVSRRGQELAGEVPAEGRPVAQRVEDRRPGPRGES